MLCYSAPRYYNATLHHRCLTFCFPPLPPRLFLPRPTPSCLLCTQDLQLILNLVATLLRNQPQLAEQLLGVTIVYNNNQTLDWVDIIIAALNVLPGLAAKAATALHSSATYTQQQFPAVTAAAATSSSNGTSGGSFAWSVLNSLADCLAAASAAAACQPSRVLTALCSCQLFEGVVAAAEPLSLVAIEELGDWVQQQQAAGAAAGSIEDWSTLGTLQVDLEGQSKSSHCPPVFVTSLPQNNLLYVEVVRALLSCPTRVCCVSHSPLFGPPTLPPLSLQGLQQLLEVPAGRYPLTRAVVSLVTMLLVQQSTWGPVPSLVGFTLHR